jgi:hypothetical protein
VAVRSGVVAVAARGDRLPLTFANIVIYTLLNASALVSGLIGAGFMIERLFDRTSVRMSTTDHRQNRVLHGVSFEQVFDLAGCSD